MTPSGLPIDTALPALRAALGERQADGVARAAVVQAPPGAGKSTVVPLALLGEPWVGNRRILVLEPRRLAARAVAERMAVTLGEQAGARVGYRTRFGSRVSRTTRIEVITEGILTRLLQDDPSLDGVAAVLFDEFHERSLHADLGLAFALESRAALRPDLRLVVMSATLAGEPVAQLLGKAAIVTAEGRMHTVETRFIGRGLPALPGDADPPERAVVLAIRRALGEAEGDALVFLPGAGEIRRVATMLEGAELGRGVEVRALYGSLGTDAQMDALAPGAPGRRRIVLATNIAETSLTIPGIRIVIDSGLERRALFDPASGMGALEVRRISRGSADQRQGRAGRTAPGVCYRLWSEGAHRSLAPHTPPEILEADLAPLALELAVWGVDDAAALRWLDPPPPSQIASARDLLRRLGALDDGGRVSAHGRAMAAVPAHPRLAHMLLRAREWGAGALAADIAAILGERDLVRGPDRDADIVTRLAIVRGLDAGATDRGALERVRRAAAQLRSGVPGGSRRGDGVAAGELLALAYPDRIGRRRADGDGRYALANGRGARFTRPDSLARAEFIVAADLDDVGRDAQIRLAAAIDRDALERVGRDAIVERDDVRWDPREEAVVARRVRELGELVIDARPLRQPPAGAADDALLEGVRLLGLDALPWDARVRALQARVAFLRALDANRDPGDGGTPPWPDLSDATLAATLADWLAPWLGGLTRRAHLAQLDLHAILMAQLSPTQRRDLDRLAPAELAVPSGSRVRIDYSDPAAPTASVRLQELFGLAETPRLGGGRVPVTFALLSPARRPVQVTRDLAGFWRGSYAEVRKAMRGRYPKHAWPDDPLAAAPVRGPPRRR